MNKILLLDSNSLLHRAYYALQQSNLSDSKGNPTGAIFGFVSMLSRLIHEEKPTHIVAAFDLKGPTFRHAMFKEYKGTRKPMPEDLVVQVPVLKNLIRDFGIKILELETYEADDIIGTVAKKFKDETVIVTGDRDSLQLVDDTTTVLYTKRGITDVTRYDEKQLLEEGFTPKMIIDYKGLRGDTSDNIPGIPGIGEKTAMALLSQYGDLEGVLQNADNIPGKLGEKIKTGVDIARLSYTLATINTNVPLDITLDDIAFSYPLSATTKNALIALEFTSLVKRFDFVGEEKSAEITKEKKIEKPVEININSSSAVEIKCKTQEIDNIDVIKALLERNKDKEFIFDIKEDIHIAFDSTTEYVLKSSYDLFGGTTIEDILAVLKWYFESDTHKLSFDLKRQQHILDEFDIKVNNADDIVLMAYLVFGGRSFSDYATLFSATGFIADKIPAGFSAYEYLKGELKNKDLDNLYYNIEKPLVGVLFNMEREGILVDKNVLLELQEKYNDEIEDLTSAIYRYAGEEFNINSPKQLTTILFDKLGLRPSKKNKTGLSVNVEVLEKLIDEHPIIALILRYRQIAKLQSTYVLGLQKEIKKDGRIHTDYKQMLTNTGRLSSTEPNLQNIPTRTVEGKEIRRAFIAGDGKVLISADYSQIELRLMAHMSGDENLIRAYNESRDIHASTASEIYGIPMDEVTSEMRRNAKAVNFGIIYGISDFGLAQNLSIRPKEAKLYIEKYFATYPKVKDFMDGLVDFAMKNGYVKTLFNRIRIMSELTSGNYNVREFGKRAAMNFPLQGTAADIIKIAMNKVFDNLKSTSGKLLLQVHDELIVECDESDAENVKNILKSSMENAVKLSVPLTVNVESGKSWYEA